MHRSDRGPTAMDTDPSAPPSRRRRTTFRRRGLVTGCAIAAALVLLPVSAQAEPSQEDLEAKVDKLTSKAEVLTEKFNGKRLALKEARRSARQAERRAAQLSRKLERAEGSVAELAATRYKSGSMQSISILTAENPRELINRATMMTHLSRQTSARLHELALAVQQAEQAEQEAQRSARKVEKITSDIRQKKEHIRDLIAEAQDKIDELEAEAASDYGAAPTVDVDVVGSGVAAQAVQIALAQQGEPYIWGASGPDAFDCSGLAVYAFGQVGVSVPHYTGAIWGSYPHVSYDEMRPGDIVFTSSHHMGIYVGNGQMVHAPNSGETVKVEDVYEFYGAVRIT